MLGPNACWVMLDDEGVNDVRYGGGFEVAQGSLEHRD